MARRIRFGGLRICALRDRRGDHASAAVTASLLSRSIRRLPVGGLLCEQSFACARNRGPSVISGQCNQFGERSRCLVPEFGVASGRTVTIIAEQTPGPVYGFDSFEGLPESWFGEYEPAPSREPATAAPSNITLSRVVRQQVAGLLADHPDPRVIPSCRLRPVFITRPQPSGARRDGSSGNVTCGLTARCGGCGRTSQNDRRRLDCDADRRSQ